ncbi:TetR/AcrR family transcriptional regulator [Aliiroseovarius sp. KMU-50]|uniref:TetR/AcrR family transcriptional regulator n=1 Tax=Aliiroseovarius salicola TaxID=3009082 RepID=A0ABT4W4U4_9RHOB|nr:TetR/AcrR family transcriptional regulator [Aliiroseovarius sp. KMU-50]MDA5095547.1 TetR/AcrR family transcriptional regulator [Aliiroseovarius sp. KMU-50]
MTNEQTRPRGSRELWLEAAYDLLVSGGIEAVKVMPLAKRLNLTRTGFYWFFDDVAELHDAMIQRWEAKNTGNLIARCEMDADNICEALFNLTDCWFDPSLFDARLDLAIRNWARTNPELERRLNIADERRRQAVSELFSRFDYSAAQAEVRGMTVMYTQIGYISMQVQEDPQERLERVQHYIELFSGVRPAQRDVERFMARHMAEVIPKL